MLRLNYLPVQFSSEKREVTGYSGKAFMEDKRNCASTFAFNYHRMLPIWGEEASVYLERNEVVEVRGGTGL